MKTVAICNHKGGSGKTTSAYYLGTLLAEMGLGTLLIDLDAQANLTGRFIEEIGEEIAPTVADALGGAVEPKVALREVIVPVSAKVPLFLAPSELQLANTAVGLLNDAVRGRTALRRAMASIKGQVDVCVIDCPPEAGIMLVNALLTADRILCPAEPEPDALTGVKRICEITDHVRREFERETPIVMGTIATSVDLRTNRHRDGLEIMKRSTLVPLRAIIPQVNGEQRDERLRFAYGSLAVRLQKWIGGDDDHA